MSRFFPESVSARTRNQLPDSVMREFPLRRLSGWLR